MAVELHARSAFSFLEGASSPEALAERAAELGLEAVALLDRGGLYGVPRFHRALRERGLRAIVGAELPLEGGARLPVLVENRAGYQRLCRLLTEGALRAPKGQLALGTEDLRAAGTEGLVALSGGEEGPLASAWRSGGKEGLRRVAGEWSALFPGAFFLEIQRHSRRGEERWHRLVETLAEGTGLPVVATGGVLGATREDRMVADLFTALRHGTTLDGAGRRLAVNGERRLESPAERRARFADRPGWVEEAERLGERLAFGLEDLGYEFPRYPVGEGESMEEVLRRRVWEGARERYGEQLSSRVRSQLEHELRIINGLGFAGYFLLVWDLVCFCRREGILVQGRGSAANSAVCYSLGITAVDPIGAGLLFERFLSEGRKGWPDIDLDLPSGERRERVIQEVYRKYGRRGAAMTANVITYRGRSALREVGKALGLPEEFLGRMANLHGRSERLLEGDHSFLAAAWEAGLPRGHPREQALARLFRKICGLPRHLGQHSGGMIIAEGQLDAVVPLEPAAMEGRSVVQWDKEDCEDLGMVKVDLLGLGMMAVLQDSLALAAARGRRVELARLPKDDAPTYDLLSRADTIGVFQVESRAQMATLPRLQPRVFYDLVVEIAIIRPGPIVGQLTHPYLERRAGRQPVDCLHPDLEPVLERTLGVPLFQEQILQMAMRMADFSGSEAEELRRALNFSRSNERLLRVQGKLRRALQAKGHPPDLVDRLVESVGSFALYGFPESHAISFALIAYASAWLKVHRTAEFYAALLNNQPMGFYAPATVVQDARRHGLRVLPLCARESDWDVRVVDDHTLRNGFRHLREVAAGTVEGLLAERARAPFASLEDLLRRVPLRQDERDALARAGAFNAWTGDRRAALWQSADQWEQAPAVAEEQPEWTGLLREVDAAPSLRPMSLPERVRADYAACGWTAGAHPLALLRPHLPLAWRAGDLARARPGQRVEVAGAVICRQRPGTAKGTVFLSLEDETGIANVIVRPEIFENHRLLLSEEPFLRCRGILQMRESVIHVLAERFHPLSAPSLPASPVHSFH